MAIAAAMHTTRTIWCLCTRRETRSTTTRCGRRATYVRWYHPLRTRRRRSRRRHRRFWRHKKTRKSFCSTRRRANDSGWRPRKTVCRRRARRRQRSRRHQRQRDCAPPTFVVNNASYRSCPDHTTVPSRQVERQYQVTVVAAGTTQPQAVHPPWG